MAKTKYTAIDTKKPSGLSISRDGNSFTFTWKIADKDYGEGLQFKWWINGTQQKNGKKKEKVENLKKTSTSRTKTVDIANGSVTSVKFAVRGKRKNYKAKKKVKGKVKTFNYNPSWSDWAEYKVAIVKPPVMSVGYALDGSNANAGTFSGEFDSSLTSSASNNPYRKYEWQSILVSQWNSSNNPVTWSDSGDVTGTMATGSGTTSSYTWYKKEDSAYFNDPDYSYTRFFRVRTIGAGGANDWNYVRHVYARPKQAYGVTGNIIPMAGNSGYTCSVQWTAPESYAYPIEQDIVNYAVIKPKTVTEPVSIYDLTPDIEIVDGKIYYTRSGKGTDEEPYVYTRVESPVIKDINTYYEVTGGIMKTHIAYPAENPSWTTANSINDTGGVDALTFTIPDILGPDECIFVKVDTAHDSHTTHGIPTLAKNGMGHLSKPKVKSIATNPSNYKISISATNASELEASFLAVYFRYENTPDVYQVIGIIKHSETQVTIQCPAWGDKEFSIGVQALIADYSPIDKSSTGVTEYSITNIRMQSDILWDEGRVPMPPKYVELSAYDSNTIRVYWDWTWTEANKAEISWADHEDAWESTDGPQTYEVTDLFSSAWNISGVSVGTWYVRVRLLKEDEDTVLYGLYSDIKTIKLSSAPAIPSLELSEGVVAEDGEVEGYWAYVSTDGTGQLQADICEATYDSDTQKYTYGDIIATTQSAQHVTIPISERNWHAGETHYLSIRVISVSGEESQGWSTPVPIRIADPLTVAIENPSFVEKTIVVPPEEEGEEPRSYTVMALTDLPLTFTVNSNGAAKNVTVMIVRAENFRMRRPDENTFDGFRGEIIASKNFDGDGTYSITKDDLTGYLDDGAAYKIVAVVQDEYGRTAESSSIEDEADRRGYFKVYWDHQSIVPYGEVEIDEEHNIAILTPKLPDELPEGYVVSETDTCDIYRLSVDAPELIYEDALFGEKYVDPYPTLGEFGGHRFVYKTANGDYTTSDNHIAFYDTTENDSDILDLFSVLIDFDGAQISLPYNVSLSNRWAKDFQQTVYLGGSVQGDWNPGVTRTGTVNTVGIVTVDDETANGDEHDGTIALVRRLANYSGICHVRTPDGSSFAANVNVSEDREEKMINKLAKYSFEITKVDSQELDGISYEIWQEMNQEEG